MSEKLNQIQQTVTPIFKQYGISRAGVFGSYARGEEKADSDIDFLIRIGRPMDLIQFIRLREELEVALGQSIDLVSDDVIIPYFEPQIKKDLVPIYE